MKEKEIVLGTSKVDTRFRVTLVQPIPKLLDIDIGDLIVFVRDEQGNIVIKPSPISKVETKE